MISSRDFVLYVLALLCVIGGIFYTLSRDTQFSGQVTFTPSETQYTATVPVSQYDTKNRLLTLQQKITAGEGLLESAPPVFKSLDQLRAEEAAEAAALAAAQATTSASLAAHYCGVPAQGPLWSGIDEMREGDTMRNFIAVRTMGTTTEQYTKFTLPARSVRSSFDSCIDSVIIGATASGFHPLQNTDAAHYYGTHQGVTIGYARDGFMIQGPVPDPETLDTCGGRYEGGVYRYHVRVGSPTLISCFAGIPAQIVLTE